MKAIGTSCSACGPKKVCLPGSTIKATPATPRPWAPTPWCWPTPQRRFPDHAQAQVRYTQSGMALKEDSLTQWHSLRRVAPLPTAHRELGLPRSTTNAPAQRQTRTLTSPCRWPTSTSLRLCLRNSWQVARLAEGPPKPCRTNANSSWAKGTVRTMAPGTTFELSDRRVCGWTDRRSIRGAVRHHRVRNNLSADAQANLMHLLGPGRSCLERMPNACPTTAQATLRMQPSPRNAPSVASAHARRAASPPCMAPKTRHRRGPQR